MNENLFEYSDMLRSPIEAFCCGTGYWEGPVSSHWHYFLELVYVQEVLINSPSGVRFWD